MPTIASGSNTRCLFAAPGIRKRTELPPDEPEWRRAKEYGSLAPMASTLAWVP